MSFNAASMVKLLRQGDDNATPVFIFPAVGGTTACWDELLNQYSGYRRTIYGLTDPHICGHPEGMAMSLDVLVQCYADAIKTKQASGPYVFMSYSFGMNDMWATAGKMIKGGDEIEQLAKREANIEKLRVKDAADPMMIEQFLLQVEDDSKVNLFGETTDSFMKNTKKLGKKAEMLDNAALLVASKLEGLDEATAKKFVERWSFHLPRFTGYVPFVMPKSVKIKIAMFDRSAKWAGSIKHDKKKYAVMQGFDRFCEGGEAQIEEMIFPSTKLPADNIYAKGAFMSKTFSLHYRFMHEKANFKLIEDKIFVPLGIL